MEFQDEHKTDSCKALLTSTDVAEVEINRIWCKSIEATLVRPLVDVGPALLRNKLNADSPLLSDKQIF